MNCETLQDARFDGLHGRVSKTLEAQFGTANTHEPERAMRPARHACLSVDVRSEISTLRHDIVGFESSRMTSGVVSVPHKSGR